MEYEVLDLEIAQLGDALFVLGYRKESYMARDVCTVDI